MMGVALFVVFPYLHVEVNLSAPRAFITRFPELGLPRDDRFAVMDIDFRGMEEP
jgi:hypothetical protein